MTPTGQLRKRLDDLDINWSTDKYYRDTNTRWRVGDFEWRASEEKDGKLLIGCTCVKYLTPEQAVAATLGAGTCYPVPIYSFDGEFTEYYCDACSECGIEWDGDTPNFCPNCGRHVIEEDE